MQYTALANVRKLRELLDAGIDVVGVGGIQSGRDAYDMLLVGANACQVATAHWKEGPKCFDRIHDELRAIMKSKGYASVKEVIGKLKPWSKEGAAYARQEKKKKNGATSDKVSSTSAPDIQFYQMLSIVLALLLAVMCADKWSSATLLPSE